MQGRIISSISNVRKKGENDWVDIMYNPLPLLRIITSIKNKLIRRMSKNIGPEYEQDIANAFAPGGEIDKKLVTMLENEQIDLLDKNQN